MPEENRPVERVTLTLNVQNCSACGGAHNGLEAEPLSPEERATASAGFRLRCPMTGKELFAWAAEYLPGREP